ncbi:DUF1828 domain-containing protein [Sinorhizobium meliloti]|uniref:DUF1828 domain-containing protein n=1 Tax=Rhizobium meliloti TaxID=382 RepID=UPI0003783937|nr:DUF1828 domain-containing protein [Sinorhizobium meliloti]MCO5962328.1 DUF1828 domain-containing protein [Sinorhizobium meliloti]
MTDPHVVLDALHRSFSDAISVRPVPSGLAINSPFYDSSGDHLAFYARQTDEGLILEDDGSFLPHLMASGIDIQTGQRRQILDTMLSDAGAYWDPDTFEIKTQGLSEADIGLASVRFLSGLLRIRALELVTRETVRSTFKDDAVAAIQEHLSKHFSISERSSLAPDLSDYPADVVLIPRDNANLRRLGVFLVNSSTQFLEAELLHTEIERVQMQDTLSAVALIEDAKKISVIGDKRYQRAVNRGLSTRFFRGDERQAVQSFQKLAA